MSIDPNRIVPTAQDNRPTIVCTLHNDPRLILAVTTIVSHGACLARLPEQEQLDLAAAALEACRETFRSAKNEGNAPPAVKLLVTGFPDRVEVIVESLGKLQAAAAADSFPKGAVSRDARGDGIEREMRDEHSRVTLVRYCKAENTRLKT